MLNLIFLTIWLINLGLVLYAKATVHVATWLLICVLPREDFAASSAKRLYSMCYHLPVMVLQLILMGKILVSVKSIAKHPLTSVIFPLTLQPNLCVFNVKSNGHSREKSLTEAEMSASKKWPGRIILIKNTFFFFITISLNIVGPFCYSLRQTASLKYFSLVVKILAKYWKSRQF